jgi:hypothetical protein
MPFMACRGSDVSLDQSGVPARGRVPWGRTGAATRRNLGDSKGQQETTNLKVSGGFAAVHLGRETAGARFHTAEPTGPRETLLHQLKSGPAAGHRGTGLRLRFVPFGCLTGYGARDRSFITGQATWVACRRLDDRHRE